MKHHKTAAVILALSMFLGAAATGCGGATPQEQEFPQAQPRKSVLITEKDYSEKEAQAFDILEDKLAADADRLLKSPYFIYNIYNYRIKFLIFQISLNMKNYIFVEDFHRNRTKYLLSF